MQTPSGFARAAGFLTSLVLAFSPVPAGAAFEDEQYAKPNNSQFGHHGILVEESTEMYLRYPSLTAWQNGEANTLACDSLGDPNCAKASSFAFNAPFANCEAATQFDCIASLAFSTSAKVSKAEFVRYVYTDHPNAFSGDDKLLPSKIGSPSVWRAPDAPHSAGDLYLVIAGHSGSISNGSFNEKKFYAQVIPVSEKFDGWNGVIDQNGFGVISQCNTGLNAVGLTVIKGCGAGAQDFGLFRCAIWEQSGTCLLRRAHALDASIELNIRLSVEPSGWLHGRIQDPQVSIKRDAGLTTLSVSAKPVRVPVLYHGGDYSSLPPTLQSFWDNCMKDFGCSVATRQAGSEPRSQANGALRNVQSNPNPFGSKVLAAVSLFAPYANDTAVAAPTAWGFRTLNFSSGSSLSACSQSSRGTVGIVTTNAMAYSEGPPELQFGSLSYSVAGLHYMPDGKTLTLGTYDLIMRSDFARCLYGFSKAPIQASISVTSVDGDSLVATTTVSERNGWIKLAAYGFTFSEKEIRVTLDQAKVAVPQTLNLAAFRGTSTKLTLNQIWAIQDFVTASENTTTLTCTAMFVKVADRARALSRARAACNAAREWNSEYSAKVIAKQTKSKSLDGRVVMASK